MGKIIWIVWIVLLCNAAEGQDDLRSHEQRRLLRAATPRFEIRLPDEIVIVAYVDNAFSTMIGAHVRDLVYVIVSAANEAS